MRVKTVVAIVGLPTSGKSSLGRALAKATSFHFVDIDEGPASCAPPQEKDPYQSEEMRARERARMTVAYTVLHAAIEANLAQGFSAIVAATYSSVGAQHFLDQAVERGGGNLKVVWCQYRDSPDEVERRIRDRLTRGLPGGCRSTDHYFDDKRRYEDIQLPHVVVMVEGGEAGLTRALGQVLMYIEK